MIVLSLHLSLVYFKDDSQSNALQIQQIIGHFGCKVSHGFLLHLEESPVFRSDWKSPTHSVLAFLTVSPTLLLPADSTLVTLISSNLPTPPLLGGLCLHVHLPVLSLLDHHGSTHLFFLLDLEQVIILHNAFLQLPQIKRHSVNPYSTISLLSIPLPFIILITCHIFFVVLILSSRMWAF